MTSLQFKVTSLNLTNASVVDPTFSRGFDSTSMQDLVLLTPTKSLKSIFVTNISETYDIQFSLKIGNTQITPKTLLEVNETFILESTLYLDVNNLMLKVHDFQISGSSINFSTSEELNYLDIYISYD